MHTLWASLVAQLVKNLPSIWETWVRSLGPEDALEKGTATHSSILAWRIPRTEEPVWVASPPSNNILPLLLLQFHFTYLHLTGFPCGSAVKESACNVGDLDSIPGLGRSPGESESKVTQSCPTLWDPMDCSLPSSSIHAIFQEGELEWVVIFFSRGSSPPKGQTRVSCIAGRLFTVCWVDTEPLFEFPEPYSKFLLAIYFTHGNVSFRVTLSIHLILSSPLPMSIILFSMSVSPLLPWK